MGLLNSQSIHQSNRIFRKQFNGIGSRGYGGLPMAAGVIAQDLEAMGEGGKGRIPHAEI